MKLKNIYNKIIFENAINATWFHGSNIQFSEFKSKLGTFNDKNRKNPIFLTSDKDFAQQYGTFVFEVSLKPNLKIFYPDKIPTGDDLLTFQKFGKKTGNFDYGLADVLENYLYEIGRDDEYNWIKRGDYSTIEQPWFYDFLNEHKFDGSFVYETGVENLFIFDPSNLKIKSK